MAISEQNKYNNLTEFLLGPVRQHPGMYLGDTKISSLAKFITGYMIGFNIANKTDDELDSYFGDDGFIEWFSKNNHLSHANFWQTYFLDNAGGDEHKGLDVYFEFLEKYNNRKFWFF